MTARHCRALCGKLVIAARCHTIFPKSLRSSCNFFVPNHDLKSCDSSQLSVCGLPAVPIWELCNASTRCLPIEAMARLICPLKPYGLHTEASGIWEFRHRTGAISSRQAKCKLSINKAHSLTSTLTSEQIYISRMTH